MTDRQNTVSTGTDWTYHDGYDHHTHTNYNIADANAKTSEICQNIKGGNIVIYTIAFEVTNNTTGTILADCAGNGGYISMQVMQVIYRTRLLKLPLSCNL